MGLCNNKGVARARVRAANRKPSILYNDLYKELKNRDSALWYYGMSQSENFAIIASRTEYETDANGEYTMQFVIDIIHENPTLAIDMTNEASQQNPEAIYERGIENSDPNTSDVNYTINSEYEFEFADEQESGEENLEDPETATAEENKSGTNSEYIYEFADDVEEDAKRTNETFSQNQERLAAEEAYNAKHRKINTSNIESSSDQDAARQTLYVKELRSIANKTSAEISKIDTKLTKLLKNKDSNKHEIRTLYNEKARLTSALSRTLAEIDNLTFGLTTGEIVHHVEDRLNKIYRILQNDNLNQPTINRLLAELDVWADTIDTIGMPEDGIEIKAALAALETQAQLLLNRLTKQIQSNFEELAEDVTSNKTPKGAEPYNFKDDIERQDDANWWTSRTMSIDRMGVTAFNIVEKLVRQSHHRMMSAYTNTARKIDKLFKGVNNDAFTERYKDGRLTGSIIHYISPEFREKESLFKLKLERSNLSGKDKYRKKLAFINANRIVLDPRILFADVVDSNGEKLYAGVDTDYGFKPADTITDAMVEAHVNEIIDALGGGEFGRQEFNRLRDRLREEIEAYKEGLEALQYERPDNGNADDLSRYSAKLNRYITYNSPYIAALSIKDEISLNAKGDTYGINFAVDKSISVPKADPDNYNREFNKIANDPKMYEAFLFYTDTMRRLNAMLPSHLKLSDSDNYFPMLDKTTYELLRDSDLNSAAELNKVFTSLYTASENAVGIDPHTGKKVLKLGVAVINQNRAEITAKVTEAKRKLKAEGKLTATGELDITLEEEMELRKQAIADIMIRKRFDIKTALKVFNYQVENYVAKSDKEDIVRSVSRLLDTTRSTAIGPDGNPIKLDRASSYNNLKKQYEYYEEVFFGYNRNNSAKGKTKYNSEDKKKYENLKDQLGALDMEQATGKMTEIEYNARRDAITDQMSELGANFSVAQLMQTVLRYSQFKGMAYNYSAAFTNMVQGYISNVIESSDGRIFNKRQLMRAYSVVAGSAAKFLSGGVVKTNAAVKIFNINQSHDIIGEVSSEIEFNKRGDITNNAERAKWKDPYVLQNSSEYLNQAPVIIATFLNTEIKYRVNGNVESTNLWDALNDDGTLRTDIDIINRNQWEITDNESDGKLFLDAISKSSQAISAIHGNYNKLTPTLMNSNVVLKSLKQFKTWGFEAVAQRIESLKYDEHLQMYRKGRWRSGFMMFTYSRAGVASPDRSNFSVIFDDTMYVTGQLIRKLMFLKTSDNMNERFGEVDAANIRKNITETIILGKLTTLAYVATLGLKAIDDDDDKSKGMMRYAINTLNRLTDDLQLYYSPTSLRNILNNIMPLITILQDMQNLAKGIKELILQDVTETGVYSGEKSWIRDISKSLPIFNRIHSTRAMTKQVMTSRR